MSDYFVNVWTYVLIQTLLFYLIIKWVWLHHSTVEEWRQYALSDLHPSTRYWPIKLFCEFSWGSILMTSIFLNSYDFLLNFKKKIFLKKWKLSVFYNDVTWLGSVGFHVQNPKRLFYSYLWLDINDRYIFELVWFFAYI